MEGVAADGGVGASRRVVHLVKADHAGLLLLLLAEGKGAFGEEIGVFRPRGRLNLHDFKSVLVVVMVVVVVVVVVVFVEHPHGLVELLYVMLEHVVAAACLEHQQDAANIMQMMCKWCVNDL